MQPAEQSGKNTCSVVGCTQTPPSSRRHRVIITVLLADLRVSHTFIYLCRLCAVSTSSTTYLFWTLPATYSFSIFGTVRTLGSLALFPSSTSYVSHTQNLSGQAVQVHHHLPQLYFLFFFLKSLRGSHLGSISQRTVSPDCKRSTDHHASAEKQEGSMSILSMWCNLSCLMLANFCPCYEPVTSPGCYQCHLVSNSNGCDSSAAVKNRCETL